MSIRLLIGGAVLSLLVGGAAAFKRPSSPPPAQALSPPASAVVPSVAPSPVPPPVPASTPAYYSQKITNCAGAGSNANFRQYPSLDPRAVLGVVAFGDSVELTGRVIQGDGVTWYEAIAPALYPSPDAEAQNKLEAGQSGWIASCFVGG